MPLIQATFGFDTETAKRDLQGLDDHARTFGQRLKSFFRGTGAGAGGSLIDTESTKRSLRDLENQSKSFSERITSHFRRSPEKRAELAFAGAARSFASGDIAGGIELLSLRMSGFGLAAGVGLGLAAVLMQKFGQQIEETRKSWMDLESAVAKPMSGASAADLSSQLAKVQSQTTDFITKQQTFGSRLAASFQKFMPQSTVGKVAASAVAPFMTPELLISHLIGKTPDSGKVLDKVFAEQDKTRGQLINKEQQLVAIKEKSLKVSETEAAIDKLSIEADEKKARIAGEAYDQQEALGKLLQQDEETKRKQFGKGGFSKDIINQIKAEIRAIDDSVGARQAAVDKEKDLDQERLREAQRVKDATAQMKMAEATADLMSGTNAGTKMRNMFDELHLLEQQLSTRRLLTGEQRKQLELQAMQIRGQIRDQRVQNYFHPMDLFNQLSGATAQRIARANEVRDLRQKMLEGAGFGQTKRDFRQEAFEDAMTQTQGNAERAERMKYHGMTQAEAWESMTPEERAGIPKPPGAREATQIQQQQQQQQQPDIASSIVAALTKDNPVVQNVAKMVEIWTKFLGIWSQ